jgi:ribosomal protein S9
MIHAFSFRAVAAAHQVCPYSNATRGNIDVVLTVNGAGRRSRGQPSRLADIARALRWLVTELTTLAAAAGKP